MQIAVVGTGYVGLVTGACLADFGHTVTCVDSDPGRIARLRQGEVPFYEPGLPEIVLRNAAAGRLRFTTDVGSAVRASTVIFLAVGTPEGSDGEADLTQVLAAASSIAPHIDGYRVIATKSTVPIGTGAWLRQVVERRLPRPVEFDVVSNPEFLREGSAVNDFMRPDRVVVGVTSERAASIMRELYRPLYLIETPVVVTDLETSEMSKYASNAFLAIKISFINEIAALCDEVGADVHIVAKAMGLDKRIGPKFLHPGPGYGGSCFPKDTRALAAMGRRFGARQQLVESAIEVNERQRDRMVQKLGAELGDLGGKEIAILGLTFKPNTSDLREAPAIDICRKLAAAGARLRAFDPVGRAEATIALADVGRLIRFPDDLYEAVAGADAVLIMTEWNEFRGLDLARVKPLMRQPVLLDARNVLDPAHARAHGFVYLCTGRQAVPVGVPVA
jgi:UDPglucose 6-dehydrogenase